MKRNGLILIVLGTLFFLVFKFIVVKIAYFKYPRDKSFNNLWEILVTAYTQGNMPNGVLHEIYGPISGIKNIVYILCLFFISLGFVLMLYKSHRG